MKTPKPITLQEHLSNAAKARWAKRTPEERSAHATKMVQAREAKRRKRLYDCCDEQTCIPNGSPDVLLCVRCQSIVLRRPEREQTVNAILRPPAV